MFKEALVRSRRLELPRELPHSDLNAARLPIPPRPHMTWCAPDIHSDIRCEEEKMRQAPSFHLGSNTADAACIRQQALDDPL
jgi:hypothetical protein